MISFTGNNLNVLIVADCYDFHHEWMSYASWYSVKRTLPDSNVNISIPKTLNPKSYYFRWTIRAGIKQYRLPDLATSIGCPKAGQLFAAYAALASKNPQPLLVMPSDVLTVRELRPETLTARFGVSEDGAVWFLNGITVDDLALAVNQFFQIYEDKNESPVAEALKVIGAEVVPDLCSPCDSDEHTTFCQVKDRCGHYNKKTWLEKAKSPLTTGVNLRTSDLSPNEHAVLRLWEQMQKSYTFMV